MMRRKFMPALGAMLVLGFLVTGGTVAPTFASACPTDLAGDLCGLESRGDAGGDCSSARGDPPFQAVLSVTGMLVEGALGLPGEPVAWAITLTNTGAAPGRDLVVTVTPHQELRVESAESPLGTVTVSDRAAVFTVPELQPGQTVEMIVRTMVLHTPPNGVLVSQVALVGNGPGGMFAQSAIGEFFAPTGLPATGYPPGERLPGEGEPSVWTVGAGALAAVLGAAVYVWYRGRRVPS